MRIDKKPLHEILKAAIPFAGAFAVKQILFGMEKVVMTPVIRMVFSAGKLAVEGVNLESSARLFLPVESQEEQTYILPAKTLVDVVGAADGDLDITHAKEGLCVKTQAGKTTFKGLGGDAIPLLGRSAEYTSLGVSSAALAQAIGLVAGAASTEVSRPGLQGVRVEVVNKEIVLAATDGFRLAVYILATTCEKQMAFIIPAKAIPGMVNCLSKQAGDARMAVTGYQVIFGLDDEGFVAAQLVEAQFPDWRQIMPKSTKTKIVFDGSLAAAIRTAKVVARESSTKQPVVSMTIGERVAVSSEVAEVGSCKIELTPLKAEGVLSGEAISFNANLLPLAEIEGGAEVNLNGPLAPAMWKNGKEGWKYLLMPVRKEG